MADARYEARTHTLGRFTFWAVYDTDKHSWPSILSGRRIPEYPADEPDAQTRVDAEVSRLNGTRQ